MSDVYILIYSGGGGRDVYETLQRGTQAMNVWEPMI
jgi:hypothetical protein